MEKVFTQPEFTLINSCISGDRKSQQELYELIAPKMFTLCLKFFKRRSDAEDVLQEGFIKLFNNLHTYKGSGVFGAWARRVFVNVAIEYARKQKKHLACMNEIPEAAIAKENSGLENLYAKDIYKLKDKLSDGYKTVFNLYAINGFSHKEIGDLLGIKESTSKSQYSRAKATIRQEIGKRA